MMLPLVQAVVTVVIPPGPYQPINPVVPKYLWKIEIESLWKVHTEESLQEAPGTLEPTHTPLRK